MNILRFLGLKKKTSTDKPYPYQDILHLWEDDYLMVELLPHENLDFVKAETQRINQVAQENFDGSGYTGISPIAEHPVKTIEKLIDCAEIERIVTQAGLEKIGVFHMQGVGLLRGEKAPLGFGTSRFALMCERKNNLVEHIWITGHTGTEEECQKLVQALLEIGQRFNFMAANWYKGEYYSLARKETVEEFVNNLG